MNTFNRILEAIGMTHQQQITNRLHEFAEGAVIEDKIRLGMAARELLDNVAFDAAVKKVEHELFTIWKRSNEPEEREKAWNVLKGLESVKAKLTGFVNEMLLEQQKINQKGQDNA